MAAQEGAAVGFGEVAVEEFEKDEEDEDSNDDRPVCELDENVVIWTKQQVAAEVEKLKSMGAMVAPMTVNNCMTIVRTTTQAGRRNSTRCNRIEFQTSYDFSNIRSVQISADAIQCPFKQGFLYRNVLLFSDKPLALIFPYLYDGNQENDLQDWILVNRDGHEVHHRVDAYSK
uniref:Uncharacterized protein n=1 Tax=Oxyrrhis marina TaxID=2969 RepID=A0A7S3URR5_OXYMA|mmetsp:Transcript_5869/g.13917  ORF Transcript_5869/g.13917 Transcript_5869/m.13917 type:complete len:173 (-) Transcript_5869:62-580(-)